MREEKKSRRRMLNRSIFFEGVQEQQIEICRLEHSLVEMNMKDALKTIDVHLNLSILFLAVNRRVWPWKWQIEFEHFIAAEILFSCTKMCWHILFSRSLSRGCLYIHRYIFMSSYLVFSFPSNNKGIFTLWLDGFFFSSFIGLGISCIIHSSDREKEREREREKISQCICARLCL